jgi:NAD(P)-dependent dehydrogenase (short-subunit alcohol dehydrogenase family)
LSQLVLITGTSSGIGLSAAIECAAAGHRVVATLRDLDRRGELEKAAAARNVRVSIEQLDVTAEGIDTKIRELILKYGPFYGLVNNAGIAVAGAFEEISDADMREQFDTNVFGLMSVTRAVLPSMRAAERGRIINVSSVSGRVGLPGFSAYAASKHAIEGFSEALRLELEMFGIQVCLVEPGMFKTPIFFGNQRRGALIDKEGPYAGLTGTIERKILEDIEKAPPPDAVGRAIARILGATSPAFRSPVGRDAHAVVTLRRVMPDRLFATGVRRLLGLPRSR